MQKILIKREWAEQAHIDNPNEEETSFFCKAHYSSVLDI